MFPEYNEIMEILREKARDMSIAKKVEWLNSITAIFFEPSPCTDNLAING
ncbi:unnamed protein product, partial [marine sediment metagenome]